MRAQALFYILKQYKNKNEKFTKYKKKNEKITKYKKKMKKSLNIKVLC
jgi:hypothetical protein